MAYRPDNSTAATAKPTRKAVGPKPNGYYQDATVVEADHVNMLTDEVCNAVEAAGLTLDKEAGAAPASDAQLLEAITLFLKGTSTNIINPFMNYALFKDVTGGVALTGWTKRTIAEYENNISGVTLSSSQVTLPAGRYYARGGGVMYKPSTASKHQSALYNATDTSYSLGGTEIVGVSNVAGSSTASESLFAGEFTISVPTLVEVHHYASIGYSPDGLGSATGASVTDVYAWFEIWKLD